MVYDVTYQVDGEERTDRVDAPHAPAAAEHVRAGVGDGGERFELLLVHLLGEDEVGQASAAD